MNLGVPVQECDPWSSPRWLAPELLFPEEFGLDCKRCTKETDVYAFVMVMYEVSSLFIPSILRSDLVRTFDYVTNVTRQAFSGSFPFEGLRDEALILRVRSGDHPRRPKGGLDLGLTNELWDMMKVCWKHMEQRWNISRIALTLERHSTTVTAEAEGYFQSGRGSDEALIQPAHKASRDRHRWRTRWAFGASSRK